MIITIMDRLLYMEYNVTRTIYSLVSIFPDPDMIRDFFFIGRLLIFMYKHILQGYDLGAVFYNIYRGIVCELFDNRHTYQCN